MSVVKLLYFCCDLKARWPLFWFVWIPLFLFYTDATTRKSLVFFSQTWIHILFVYCFHSNDPLLVQQVVRILLLLRIGFRSFYVVVRCLCSDCWSNQSRTCWHMWYCARESLIMLSHRLIISSLSPSNLALSCIGFVAAGPSFCPVILNEKFEGINLKPVVF